jgi:hypothetical protein
MESQPLLDEYLQELRARVCSRCIERPEGGPPCAPLGKRCGIEMHLPDFIEVVHGVDSVRIDPYLVSLHDNICGNCTESTTSECPCPLKYLLPLAVEAIETVDGRY